MPVPKHTSDSFNNSSSADVAVFFAAVMDSDLKKVSKMLDDHPDAPQWTDRAGNTPLMMAVIEGDEQICGLLIDKGADVNAVNKHGGNTLARAAHFGHKELVEKLIGRGADVHMKDAAGQDAAAWAEMNGHDDIASVIVQAQKSSKKTPPQNKP